MEYVTVQSCILVYLILLCFNVWMCRKLYKDSHLSEYILQVLMSVIILPLSIVSVGWVLWLISSTVIGNFN